MSKEKKVDSGLSSQNIGKPDVSRRLSTERLQLMHFKYGNHCDFTEEEMDEFRKNEDNYYLYTHFMLKDYRGHTLQKLGVFDQSEEDINRKQVISYYVDEEIKCSCELPCHLPFQVGVKYNIGELMKLMLS